ncbi:hypothetical protein [Flavobacterium sp.]|jgi:hypothetical protein|uniref:hypothetical protein n=1 Tax=Flavobacterium sp. TaxID=239 RepID=UPI0037C14D8D
MSEVDDFKTVIESIVGQKSLTGKSLESLLMNHSPLGVEMIFQRAMLVGYDKFITSESYLSISNYHYCFCRHPTWLVSSRRDAKLISVAIEFCCDDLERNRVKYELHIGLEVATSNSFNISTEVRKQNKKSDTGHEIVAKFQVIHSNMTVFAAVYTILDISERVLLAALNKLQRDHETLQHNKDIEITSTWRYKISRRLFPEIKKP